MSSAGLYYIATGEAYANEACQSARRAREVMPEIDIAIATDQGIDGDVFDKIIEIENPEYSFRDQLKYIDQSPFENTLNIDTDIYIDNDVSCLFSLLDQFDIGAVINPQRPTFDICDIPESFPEYNTGVVLFKNSSSFSDFVERWRSEYSRLQDRRGIIHNQPSFRNALYKDNIRIVTLPPEYNCVLWRPGQVSGPVKIFHGRFSRNEAISGMNYSLDIENISKTLNRTHQPRTFTQLGGFKMHSNRTDSLLHRARVAYRYEGIGFIISRSYHKMKQTFKDMKPT